MNSLLKRAYLISALAVIALSAYPAMAEVGFQASLETPPSFVSPYFEDEDQFSVALYPRTKIYLSDRLVRSPRVVGSSWDNMSLRFNTEYYVQGEIQNEMVPVTVHAKTFSALRIERNVNQALREGGFKLLDGAAGKRREGLGVSVALPKRLDRIFGEGGAGLKVAGYRRIMFAGRSQWNDAADSDIYRQNKFPSLRMEQVSRFDITGNIGSKITVKVSQDSQTDIPLANTIQIRYKGDDDDMLRSIEAGNTTLSLPNTQFVGYSSRIRGLFGVKAEAQIGRLNLVAIASQEKGSTERASVSATGEENADFIRDYDYQERRIFDLGYPEDFGPGDLVTNLKVYETISTITPDLEATEANLWVDPDNQGGYDGEDKPASGQIKVKELGVGFEEFQFINDLARNLRYVVFTRPRDMTRRLGYWMEVKRANGDVDTVGDVSGSIYDLKLLALARDETQPEHKTWDLMWRNCYPIQVNIKIEDIKVKILKGLEGTEATASNVDFQSDGARYIEILGLDQEDGSGNERPDGLLDDDQIVFRPDWGLLIFPHRQPFDSDTTYEHMNGLTSPPLAVRVPGIYEYVTQITKREASQYYIQLITSVRSSIIKLDRVNIIEGSETITLDGRQLSRGTDYTINYEFGQITLTAEGATDPNASLNISYEYAPFFAVQKKTLLGARAEYEWNQDFKFGATFLYKSDKTQERKPKVGQETARTVILDGDMSLRLYPNFLTKLADALPFVQTETPSNMSIVAEVAQSRPNPNVDGVAYVDDFETALEELALGTIRTRWKQSSRPYELDSSYVYTKMLWHSPRELPQVSDVYERETAQGESVLRTMRMIFRPDPDATATGSWSGITRYMGSVLDAKRAQLFEVRLRRGSDIDSDDVIEAKIHFDFGVVNEDLNNDGFAFTEDTDGNGAVDNSEDSGLDGVHDGSGETPTPWGTDHDLAGDNWYFNGEGECPFGPGGCDTINWDLDEWYYEFLNGTEGNIKDAAVAGVPDAEILSRGNSMETSDRYFSFVLDLSSDEYLVPNSEKNGWVTYRIPIRDSLALNDIISSSALMPSWNEIKHVRVWFESDSGQVDDDTLEIADWYFVQSNWQDSVIFGPDSLSSRTKFVVAEMSDDVNSDFQPPPGVEAYTDPTTNVTEAQRALLMKFENLRASDTCQATKNLLSVDRYSGYRRLEMFVYGAYDSPEDEGKIRFFFRIGQDVNNYYEYYSTVYQGWDERNAVNIDFNAITALKDEAQSALESGFDVDYDDSLHYRILGNPDINKVRYFAAGLINTDSASEISGQLWLDELRVSEVRRDVGTAGRVQVTGNMADLFSYSFSFESRDPYFRGLSTSTRGGSTDNLGSGQTNTTVNYGVTFNINKFVPRSWGAQLPVSYRYTKTVQTPLLRTNSDIVLPEDRRKEEQSVRDAQSVSATAKFARKGSNPLFNLLLNRLKTSLSYSRNTARTVTTPYTFGESYNVRSTFDFSVQKVPMVPVFFWTKRIPLLRKLSNTRMSVYPENWTTSGDYRRSLSITDDVNLIRRSSNAKSFDGRLDMRYKPFPTISLTYGVSTKWDLSDPSLVNISFKDLRPGRETNYAENLNASYDPRLLSFLRTSLSYKVTYSDDLQRSYDARRSALSRSYSVGGEFDHKKLFSAKPKTAGRRVPTRKGDTVKSTETKPFYVPILRGFQEVMGWIDPFTYNYGETYSNSLPAMDGRPGWGYRLGLRDEADVGEVVGAVGTRTSQAQKRYDISSGFTLLGGISTKVKFARTMSEDIYKQGARNKSTSTSWPDLSVRIQRFKHFPLVKDYLNKFIDIFGPRTGFSRQTKEAFNLDGGFLISKSEVTSYKPLLSITFRAFRSLSLSAAYSVDLDNKENYNSTTGNLQNETRSTKKAMAMTAKYSFTSPNGISLPIFGRVKFNSTVDLEMTVRFNSELSKTAQAGGEFATTKDKSDVMFSPVISYTFSRQMKGGLTMRWQDSNDNYRSRKSHTREVQIWTEISF